MAATSRPTYEELEALFQKSETSRQKLRSNLVTGVSLPSPPPPGHHLARRTKSCARASCSPSRQPALARRSCLRKRLSILQRC